MKFTSKRWSSAWRGEVHLKRVKCSPCRGEVFIEKLKFTSKEFGIEFSIPVPRPEWFWSWPKFWSRPNWFWSRPKFWSRDWNWDWGLLVFELRFFLFEMKSHIQMKFICFRWSFIRFRLSSFIRTGMSRGLEQWPSQFRRGWPVDESYCIVSSAPTSPPPSGGTRVWLGTSYYGWSVFRFRVANESQIWVIWWTTNLGRSTKYLVDYQILGKFTK